MSKYKSRGDRQIAALSIAIDLGIPVYLVGAPAMVKTKTLQAMAVNKGRHLDVQLLQHKDPTDFGWQVPDVQNGCMRTLAPDWILNMKKAGETSSPWIEFFDEVNWASPRVQASCLTFIQDKKIGPIEVAKVSFVMAGNPPDQGGGGFELNPPFANRIVHINWEPDTDPWIEGMMSGVWTIPDIPTVPSNWEERVPAKKAMIASYIKTFPHKLHVFPEAASQQGGPWPSRRTWEMVSWILAGCEAVGINGDVELELIAGAIGQGAAIEFLTWLRELDMPDPEALLKDPDSFKLPSRQDKTFAVLAAVSSAVIAKMTMERWKAGWKVMAKAAKLGSVDVAAAAAKQLAIHRPKGAAAPQEAVVFLPLFQKAGLL